MERDQEISIQEKLRLFRRVVQTSEEESVAERRRLQRERFEKTKEQLENEVVLLRTELRRKAGRESAKEALRSEREAKEALREERLLLRGQLYETLMRNVRDELRCRLADGSLAGLLQKKLGEGAPVTALRVGPEYRALLPEAAAGVREEAGLEGVLAEREDGLILNFTLDELLLPLRREAAKLLDGLFSEGSPAAPPANSTTQKEAGHER